MKTIRFKLDVVAYIDTDDVERLLIQPEPDEAAIVEAIIDLTGGELFEPKHFMESGLLMGWKVAADVDFVAIASARRATQELESKHYKFDSAFDSVASDSGNDNE